MLTEAENLLVKSGFRHTTTHLPFANETGRLDFGKRFAKVGRYGIVSYAGNKSVWLNDRTAEMIINILS